MPRYALATLYRELPHHNELDNAERSLIRPCTSQRLAGLPIKRVPEFIDLLSHLEVFGRNPSCRMRDKTYCNFVVGNIHVRMILSNFPYVSNSTGKEYGCREARERDAP